jgi:ELWxxDGT repeat protein
MTVTEISDGGHRLALRRGVIGRLGTSDRSQPARIDPVLVRDDPIVATGILQPIRSPESIMTKLLLTAIVVIASVQPVTAQLARRVKDINATQNASSSPGGFVRFGDALYFGATGGLWRTDGTPSGTFMVREIDPAGFSPGALTVSAGKLYFVCRRLGTVFLWASDGTAAGTRQVIRGQPSYLRDLGGVLLFSMSSVGLGSELWRSDGTPEGTVLVKDIRPGPGSSLRAYTPFTIIGETLFLLSSARHCFSSRTTECPGRNCGRVTAPQRARC